LDYCKQNGIKKIFSPAYNSENNSLAERFNQTIISCAKTLLFWSQLSENFWDFTVNYVNYLYNLIPHSSINNKIQNEVFFKTKSNIKHIKVFGCIAYYKNYNQNKQKFEPNSVKGIFLGVDEDSYSYIMNYNNFKIYKFQEIYYIENIPANISLSNEALDETQNDFFKYDFTNIKSKYYTNINNSIFTISNSNDYNQGNDNINDLNKLFSNLRISDNSNNNIQGHSNDNTYRHNNIVDNNKNNYLKSTNDYSKQLLHVHNKNHNNANYNISTESKNFKDKKQIQLSDHKNSFTPDNFSNNNNTNNSINPNTNKVEFTPDKFFVNNNKNNKLVSIKIRDPKNYEEAVNCNNKLFWINAINEELKNFYNKTMTFVKTVPPNSTLVSNKWIFTTKKNTDGKISKFKARLVARGFEQRFGIDFYITYSPTLNMDCLKLILGISSKFNWDIQQLDIKSAYL